MVSSGDYPPPSLNRLIDDSVDHQRSRFPAKWKAEALHRFGASEIGDALRAVMLLPAFEAFTRGYPLMN
jgi:hypothetical protein